MSFFRNPLVPFRKAERRRVRRGRRLLQLEGLETRCVLSGISATAQYPIPSGNAAWYMTTGSDGNLWFTEGNASKVGVMNATTHAVTEFATPTANSAPREIAAGPDGNIWFTEFTAGKIGMVNPTTHVVTEFAIPNTGQPWGITAGPDGNIWFAQRGGGAIGMYNLTTRSFSSFHLPGGGEPNGITFGPDGNLWFADYAGKIGEINPTTHVISEFAIPTHQPNPYDITAGDDGNIWFTVFTSNDGTGGTWVGSINPTTHAFTMLATSSAPSGITTGPDGNLWFGDGQLGSINPTTDAASQFPVAAARGITTGPDGNLWLASGSNITVATLSQSETDLVVTQQPPSSVTAGAGFGLTVAAEDGSGNVLTSFNGTVTVALGNNPGGGSLGGATTATAVNGVATFSGLSLTKADPGYTLVASAGLDGEGITGAFAVTPAAATQIVITQQPPSSVGVNAAFTVVAAIEDQYGNIVTSANNAVTVALGNNPGGSTLGGTTTETAVNGIVTFSNLTLNKKGKGYTLRLGSSGLTGATTSSFNVG